MTKEIIAQNIDWLIKQDQRLAQVSALAGEVLPRSRPAGFEGLARVICGQQLSVASANAIWTRLLQANSVNSAKHFLATTESTLREAGLSQTKVDTINRVAAAITNGELNLEAIATQPAELAIATLTGYKGIGPWTADVYLLFCAAHPDIFPAGDLALRRAVGKAFNIEPHPSPKTLAEMALQWSPKRTTAALLFWRYYAAIQQRKAIPI